MITRNGNPTAWTDEVSSLVEAAHETAFGHFRNQRVELVSEQHEASIVVDGGIAYTESEAVRDEALEQNYWIIVDDFMTDTPTYEILLNWSQDPSNPPKNGAIHKSYPDGVPPSAFHS